MSPIRRLALIPLAVLAGLAGLAPLSGAQSPGSARFAFADTTLLRDTLGLHFDGLLQTADSLRMLPDSLRAQVIRYRLPIRRLLVMADSMGVPVDSVGSVILQESRNPLAAGNVGASHTTFKYTSNYTVGRDNTTWENGSEYSMTRGALLLHNGTTISMNRLTYSHRLTLQQDRHSSSEANWRLSPNLSFGGRAALSGFDHFDPGATDNQGERKSEFSFSSVARQRPSKDLTSNFNLLLGYLDLKNFSQIKRGLSGDLNGRVKLQRGNWFSHDLNGGVNGNLSRTRKPTSIATLGTSDYSGSLRGALLIFQSAPVGLNVNYSVRTTRVEAPTDSNTVTRLLTSNSSVDGTVRMRLDNDRYLNLTGSTGGNNTLSGSRTDHGFRAEGRWVAGPWQLDANGSNQLSRSDFFRRGPAGGYFVRDLNRQAQGTLTRPFGRKLVTKLDTSILLGQSRSTATNIAASPPTDRDSYRQSYRFDTIYNQSDRLTSGVALDVSLVRSINLPAQSTSNNTDTRSYRAEWRWSYRMLRGLTASQNNTVQADYEFFPFATERNDVSLDYNSVTNLTAVLTPRLTVDVTHNARQHPRGDWRVLSNGSGVLLPSDQDLTYTLHSNITWSPSPALSFTITPDYLASDNTGTSNGVEVPTHRSRRLNMSGRANLNVTLGRKGMLSGNIGRSFSSSRTTTFLNGLPLASPLSQTEIWNGLLQLSWEL